MGIGAKQLGALVIAIVVAVSSVGVTASALSGDGIVKNAFDEQFTVLSEATVESGGGSGTDGGTEQDAPEDTGGTSGGGQGDIDELSGAYSGGIVGYNNAGILDNCTNYGTVLARTSDDCPETAASQEEGKAVTGNPFAAGLGTVAKPYIIANEEQLYNVRYYLDGHFRLVSNIILTSDWTPIGTEDNPFTGYFDGYGYTIRGLNIGSSTKYSGLFRCNGGTIANLNVEGTVSNTVSASDAYAGGIVGYNSGTVGNCSFSGDVTVSSSRAYVGGIAGYNCGVIAGCNNFGNVIASSSSNNLYADAATGYDYGGRIENCNNYGSVLCRNQTE